MNILMLQVEYGSMSETYDFDEIIVISKDEKTIDEICGFWYSLYIKIFKKWSKIIYYGHSYAARDILYADLNNKKISIHQKSLHRESL